MARRNVADDLVAVSLMLRMSWIDLAFLHWPVAPAALRTLVPRELDIESFDGSAWVGVVPFEMRDVSMGGLPAIPAARDFLELNVRTYVRYGDRGGVYFFSLDAASLLAVIGARVATNLPYHHARMSMHRMDDSIAYYSVRRGGSNARSAEFRARYRPTGRVYVSEPGTFDFWCTERRSLFTRGHSGALNRLDIEHARWPLQAATADIETNTMASAAGIALPDTSPRVLFAKRLDVVAHWPKRA